MENPRSRSAAQWRPPTWRSLVTTLTLVLGFVVTVVFLLSTAVNFFLVPREPQAAVDSYLDQLERGSSRQVLASFNLAGGATSVQVLPNPVYHHAANRPVAHHLVSVRERGDQATVVMDVRTGDGRVHRLEYRVERHTATGFLNDTWRLRQPDAAAVSVHVPAAVGALAVNGQTVRLDAATVRSGGDSSSRVWRFEGLPGEYHVGLPESSFLMARTNASAGIDLDAPRPVSLDLDFIPSPRMWQQVDRAIADALDRCETSAGMDEGCPVPRGWAKSTPASSEAAPRGALPSGVSGVRWKVESRPALVLQRDGEDPLRYRAQRYRPAVATVSYVRGGKPFTQRVEFGVEATAHTTGDTLETAVQLRPALTPTEQKYPES